MPVYTCKCRDCETYHDYMQEVENHKDSPSCPVCDGETIQVITVTKLHIPFPATMDRYVSPASGKVIDSMAKRRDDFARTNTRPSESLENEKSQMEQNRKYAAEKRKKERKKTYEKIFKDHMGDKVVSKETNTV